MIRVHACDSILAIARQDWNDCFADELEDWDYHLAVERAGVEDFRWRYLAVFEDERLLAVAAAFTTVYRLDTTVQGPTRRLTESLSRLWPGLLQLSLYAIGSPLTERCSVGLARHVAPARRGELYRLLLDEARRDADRLDIGLMAVKDAPQANDEWARSCLAAGLQSMPSLPSAVLEVPFGSLEAYLGSLGKSTRKGLRRNLRAVGPRVEWRDSVDDVLPDMMRLYEATLARSELQFERLPSGYFTETLAQLRGRARCVLYWVEDRLVAFNLILVDRQRLVDKFFAHDVARTREYNLYARSWLTNVEYCIGQGIGVYEAGQAGYATKLRLGCRLERNTLFFHHRNRLINGLLSVLKRFLRPDRFDTTMALDTSE